MTFRKRMISLLAALALWGGTALVVAPTADAATCYQQMWRINSRGTCVVYIQRLLNYTNYVQPPLVVDGVFGPKTDYAVRVLQWWIKLQVDGIVGPKTWTILCGAQAGPGPIATYPYATAKAAGCPGY